MTVTTVFIVQGSRNFVSKKKNTTSLGILERYHQPEQLGLYFVRRKVDLPHLVIVINLFAVTFVLKLTGNLSLILSRKEDIFNHTQISSVVVLTQQQHQHRQ